MNPHVQEVSKQVTIRTSRQSTRALNPSISVASPSTKASPQVNRPSSPGVSISISDEGLKMAQTMSHPPLSTQGEAKAVISQVETAIKTNPQEYKDIHSNLRTLRINHLLYD